MSKKRFQQLQNLFDRLIDQDGAEQEAELERIRSEDPDLADRLARLLKSADSGTRVVGNLVEAAAEDLAEIEDLGKLVGSYRLVRELGRGGMGVVYLADRADGTFEQQVAVKLIPAGVHSRPLIERFEAERQILAQLNHPHIARLLDGGTADGGLPYLVMEYVDGKPIDVYCDRNRLSTTERLALFREVCAAVESAHRKLVVHRDLKPSNILVVDGGFPKLLDFGIAKLLENDLTANATAVTLAGDRVMTPEYASPEQVKAEPVSTATDIYALGLLLYELLTGHRAHRLSSYRPEEVERVVCRTAPDRPSTVVTEDLEPESESQPRRTAEEVSRARGTAPLKLKKRLAGDLDNIVMMALRKEPERRYGSVAEFSEDLRRHLEGLPVLAHADSWSYRTRKFAGRNTIGLAASLLVLLSLVAGLVGTTVQARRASEEARRAEETNEFLIELLESSDPERALGRELTVREVLSRAGLRIENELSGQPKLQATMQTVIGRLFEQLGLYEESEKQLRTSLSRRQALLGKEHVLVGETREFLASVLAGQGRFDEAEREAQQSLLIRERTVGADSSAVAQSLSILGYVHYKQGRYEEAREVYERAIAIETEQHGANHVAVARIATDLAASELGAGRLGEAERLLRGGLVAWRGQGSGKSLDLATTLDALSGALMLSDSLAEAEETLNESLEIRLELLGGEHPLVAYSLTNIGILRRKKGDMVGAESAYREALRIQQVALGPEHPAVATLYNNLAVLMHVQDRFEEAVPYYQESLELRRRVLGPEHPLVGTTISFLAFALHRAGDEGAESLYREALDQLVASRGTEHPDVANVLNDLGRLLIEEGSYQEAEPKLRAALRIRKDVFGEENRRTTTAKLNLGACLVGLAELSEAEGLLRAARAQQVDRYAEGSLQVVEVDIFLAHLLSRQGQRQQAFELADACRQAIHAAKGEDHWMARLARTIAARL